MESIVNLIIIRVNIMVEKYVLGMERAFQVYVYVNSGLQVPVVLVPKEIKVVTMRKPDRSRQKNEHK